jgi:hypothetical protein
MTKIMDFGKLKVGVIEDNHWMGVLGSTKIASYHAIAIALSLMEAYSLNVQHE